VGIATRGQISDMKQSSKELKRSYNLKQFLRMSLYDIEAYPETTILDISNGKYGSIMSALARR
jgi:hypothetical protein